LVLRLLLLMMAFEFNHLGVANVIPFVAVLQAQAALVVVL